MCIFGSSNDKPEPQAPPPTIIPQAPKPPDAPPDALEIKKDQGLKSRRKRNPLRIDVGAPIQPSKTGVNI
ncbi:hypothetical protein [Bartonella sp. DGB2]|uniref:hypothetical protein n=1 Tax=Bartonella sp. DGB2 TaxID=3388426 RepID=UPI00398FA26B